MHLGGEARYLGSSTIFLPPSIIPLHLEAEAAFCCCRNAQSSLSSKLFCILRDKQCHGKVPVPLLCIQRAENKKGLVLPLSFVAGFQEF